MCLKAMPVPLSNRPMTTLVALVLALIRSLAFLGIDDMATIDPRVKPTVVQLMRWLVAGDYAAIEQFTLGVRLSASLIRQAITDYGRTLVMPPASVLDQLDVIEVDSSNPKAWSVRVDLWTVEEGRSDLSLECTLIDSPGDLLTAEVDNLHVP